MSKVQVDTIDTRSGTSTMQIGSTNTSTINIGVSGDTVNIPSGVTIANAGTATGFGGENAPVFKAYQSSTQTISNTTYTVVNLQSTSFDPSSKFNTSTYRFTPTVAGYYFLQAQVRVDTSNDMQTLQATIRKNGSAQVRSTDVSQNYGSAIASAILYSDADDYFDMEVYQDAGGNTDLVNNAESTFFQGFRLI